MSWRTAKSLLVLRDEVNALAPRRSRISDGAVGDTAHGARTSRHNPNRYGVVTALDLTHDPKGGCDIHAIARQVAKNPHDQLAYIISNRQIASKDQGWRWRRYSGSNPHTIHAHFAVGVGPDSRPEPPYDSTASWGISTVTEDAAMEELITGIQEAVKDAGQDPGPIDGAWGPRTQAGLTAALKGSTAVAGGKTYKGGPYPDVPADHTHAASIARARDLGLLVGRANGTFGPAEPLSRAAAATVLVRLYDLLDGDG